MVVLISGTIVPLVHMGVMVMTGAIMFIDEMAKND